MNYIINLSKTILYASFTFTLAFMTVPESALAHKVSIFAWVESDTVYTLSKFSGGKMVKKGTVEVYDAKDLKLLDGLTDNQGEFSFKIPKKAALRVVLIAGTGHKSHWNIPIEEIEGVTPESTAGGTDEKTTPGRPENTRFSEADDAALQAAIEKALDKKLKPVMKLLAEAMQKGPSLSEILGGIGYIIGLVGIAAYFKSRKK
jgi:nickel transport protein